MQFKTFVTLLLAFWAYAAGVSAQVADFPTPDKDPFYVPPAGFESATPGTIFRSRPPLRSGVAGASLAAQVLFRTNGASLEPTVSVATILQGANASKRQLYVFSTAEDAVNITCAPSYWFNSNNTNITEDPTDETVTTAIANGWTVVIVDYEGVNASFSVGHLEGRQVLDGIRAALRFPAAGLSKNTVVGAYGYSGGAIATGWAAALQPSYAPELPIVGWAFGGTPANITSTLLKLDGGFGSGLAAAGFVGQASAYPEVVELFSRVLTPAGVKALARIRSTCETKDVTYFAFKSFLRTKRFQTLGPAFLQDPTVQSVSSRTILGLNATETPKAPIYMFHGTVDELIPYESALSAAQQWCTRGSRLVFTSNQGTGHYGTEDALRDTAIAWLTDRLNGAQVPSGCTFVTTKVKGSRL